jgi:hypothetical protein
MKYEWLGLKEAVQLIAGRLDGENAKAREREASGELYEALRHGRVRSRAGRVDRAEQVRNPEGDYGKSAPLWALANTGAAMASHDSLSIFERFQCVVGLSRQ